MTTLLPPAVLIFGLASVAVAGVLSALLVPAIRERQHRRARIALTLGAGPQHAAAPRRKGGSQRHAIERTLKEIEAQQEALHGARVRPSLRRRIREAGLAWSPARYWSISAVLGLAAALAGLVATPLGPLAALAGGIVAGLGGPHLLVAFARRRRLGRFSANFPDAIDVIVRGVRSGRPVADCFAIVASDSEEPIRSEFLLAVEDQAVGLPLDDVCRRLSDRVPLQEVSFLAIVVSIQSRTGGSLTEALGNLSTVLRARRQLRAKVMAMSSEAKTSAGIIGALPLLVAGLVQVTSPDYIAPLFDAAEGRMVLGACAAWMGLGILVMRNMINFDI